MPRKRPFKRTDRLASQIQQTLALALQRESHEEVLRAVVVTGVEVTRDLSLARVFYYVMGGDPDAVAAGLERARGFLRRRVGEEVRARITPELRFALDTSIDHGRRVEEILRDLNLAPVDDAASSDDGGGDAGDDDPNDDSNDALDGRVG